MLQTLRYKNDCTLSYALYGNPQGFPVIIQHGLIASIKDANLFERLVQLGARLICIARPGYGESTPYEMQNYAEWGEIVAELIVCLQLTRFDLFGISSGAPYTYALGNKFPEQARNIFILSGLPALYDPEIRAHWPYPIETNADMAFYQTLAYRLFFSYLSSEDEKHNFIQDSARNHYFGVAQDLKLRGMPWGFRLSAVHAPVFMRHSRVDDSVPFITAQMTANLLPNCHFDVRDQDEHFSDAVLDEYIRTVMADWYRN